MKTMKKSIAVLLAVLMLVGVMPFAFAADLTWELDEATGALTITGEGAMKNFVNAPWKSNAAQILSVEIGEGITSIGNKAFVGCENLTTVALPATLTKIGEDVFSGCAKLETIAIPETVTTFGNRAFDGCVKLQSFTFPAGVQTVGSQLFRGCAALQNVALPEELTAISFGMFYGCTALAEIEITKEVKTIGSSAFQNCTSLTMITLPLKVTNVSSAAFSGCTNLHDIYVINPRCSISSKANTIPAGATIHAVEESAADYYAQQNGLKFDPIEIDPSLLEEEEDVEIPTTMDGFFKDGFLKKLIDKLRKFYLALLKLFGLRNEKVVSILDEIQNPPPLEEETSEPATP